MLYFKIANKRSMVFNNRKKMRVPALRGMGKHQAMKAQQGFFFTSTNSKHPENSTEGKMTARPLQVKIEVHFSGMSCLKRSHIW